MLKLVGLMFVFISLTGVGICMAGGARRELETTEEMLRLLRRIGSDVRCYKRPLPEIYEHFESEKLREFLQMLRTASVGEAFDKLSADPAVRQVCEPFFLRAGRCSSEECQRLQDDCTEELERLAEGMKDAVATKARVYRSLGLAGGAMAVILLL